MPRQIKIQCAYRACQVRRHTKVHGEDLCLQVICTIQYYSIAQTHGNKLHRTYVLYTSFTTIDGHHRRL